MSIKINVQNGYNERYAPEGAKKAYLARITGRDSKMTFAREFLGRGEVILDEPGLYEHRDTDKRGRADDGWILVLDCPDFPDQSGGTLRSFWAKKEDAMKIAKEMDKGRRIDHICEVVDATAWKRKDRTWAFVSPRQAEKAEVAKTIDQATEACWAVLSGLPEREAKKVLTSLRQRLTPPKQAQELGLAENTPSGIVADANQDAGVSSEQLGLEPTPIIQ